VTAAASALVVFNVVASTADHAPRVLLVLPRAHTVASLPDPRYVPPPRAHLLAVMAVNAVVLMVAKSVCILHVDAAQRLPH
jgi:hypothetical protein